MPRWITLTDFLWGGRGLPRHVAFGILVPQSNLQWKHGVLTTGPPGKSLGQFWTLLQKSRQELQKRIKYVWHKQSYIFFSLWIRHGSIKPAKVEISKVTVIHQNVQHSCHLWKKQHLKFKYILVSILMNEE